MFAAGLEFLASRPPGTIPSAGNELNIIGTGSARVPDPWEDKVRACMGYIGTNRSMVRSFMLGATKQAPGLASVAEEAIDSLLALLGVFVADLSGAYSAGRTAAHWFKVNQHPVPTPAFTDLLSGLEWFSMHSETHRSRARHRCCLRSIGLRSECHGGEPTAANLTTAAANLTTVTVAAITTAGLAPATAGVLLGAVGHAQTTAGTLGSLSLAAPLAQLRRSHAAIQAFFEQSDPGTRMMEQVPPPRHPHEVPSFRDFYPFGLVRTHFQHVNARQVRVHLPTTKRTRSALHCAL